MFKGAELQLKSAEGATLHAQGTRHTGSPRKEPRFTLKKEPN